VLLNCHFVISDIEVICVLSKNPFRARKSKKLFGMIIDLFWYPLLFLASFPLSIFVDVILLGIDHNAEILVGIPFYYGQK
jgi:hypothetical protein